MKKFISVFTLTVIFLGLLYGLGPVVDLSYDIKSVEIPADIETFVRTHEAKIPGIKPGTEKAIHWAHATQHDKTRYSIVYLHGFSASRQEVAPLCALIAKHLDANIFYTRLPGHGRDSAAMGEMTLNSLLNDAAQSLEIGKALGDRVIVIGTSTGGSLATWLASQDIQHRIFALILISPNFGPKRSESELMLLPWGNLILQLVEGETYHFEPRNAEQQRYWTTSYPSRALLTMMGLVKIARLATLKNITTPTLVLYDKQDEIVDVAKTRTYTKNFSDRQLKLVEINGTNDPQRHIIAGDILSPDTTTQVVAEIETFIDALH